MENGSFLAITDLTLYTASRGLLKEDEAVALAKYFLSFHATQRPDVAYALLRITAILRPLTASAVSVRGSFVGGQLQIVVTDILDEVVPNLAVYVKSGDLSSEKARFDGAAYVVEAALGQGVHTVVVTVGELAGAHIQVRDAREAELATTELQVTRSVPFTVTAVELAVDGRKGSAAEAGAVQPKSFVQITVSAALPASFTPSTALLQVRDAQGRQTALAMQRTQTGFQVQFSPAQKELAAFFDYADGVFELALLCGDALLEAPVTKELMRLELQFGPRPAEPVYPLYSKPLMYATEMSTKPMREIEHVFHADNKNPFFLFPVCFVVAIGAALLGMILLWRRIGFEAQVRTGGEFDT